jgi:hypothetical protein
VVVGNDLEGVARRGAVTLVDVLETDAEALRVRVVRLDRAHVGDL